MAANGRVLKRVVLKEELVALTDCPIKAMILNQFLYWQERTNDIDKYIIEEQTRAQYSNARVVIPLTNGWIYKSSDELAEELMNIQAPRSIARKLKELVDDGYLESRNNPHNNWDKTLQYRVNIIKVKIDLHKIGYALEGYALLNNITIDFSNVPNNKIGEQNNLDTEGSTSDTSIRHSGESIRQNGKSTGQYDYSNCQSGNTESQHDKSNGQIIESFSQGGGAIPEIILNNTLDNNIYNTKTKNSLSVSNNSKRENRQTDYSSDYLNKQNSDIESLNMIKKNCQLDLLESELGTNIKQITENALEMMFFAESLKVGNSIIPQSMVRSRMYTLHASILFYALEKVKNNTENTEKIKRSTNYLISTIYNSITEIHTDAELDPGLNHNRYPISD